MSRKSIGVDFFFGLAMMLFCAYLALGHDCVPPGCECHTDCETVNCQASAPMVEANCMLVENCAGPGQVCSGHYLDVSNHNCSTTCKRLRVVNCVPEYVDNGSSDCPYDPPYIDNDGDGYSVEQGDCDDWAPLQYPGSPYWQICAQYYDLDCNGMDDFLQCQLYGSPIVIDIEGDGYELTSKAGGVIFDLNSDGVPDQLAWTTEGDDDAWLALDRNGNGVMDNGTELFGGATSQPDPPSGATRNGFLALAVFDMAENGGNNDGVVDSGDTIFSQLRLWTDINHNGVSEPNELHSMLSLGVTGIDLHYRASRRTDEHGNIFKYRSKVYRAHGAHVNRWAWDVILLGQ